MRERLTVPGLLLVGLAGAGVRIWSLKTAYEPVADLAIPGAPALLVLKIFAAAVPVLALLASLWLRGKKGCAPGDLYANLSVPAAGAGIFAGALLCAGAVLGLGEHGAAYAAGREGLVLAACGVDVLLAAAGVCMMRLSYRGRSPKGVSRHGLTPLIPGFAGCFALVIFYQNHSRDPVVSHYCWMLLCLMASILAFYYQAAYAFDRVKPVSAQCCTMTAGVYAILALPDAETVAQALLLTAVAVWMLRSAALIARGGAQKRWSAPDAAPTEDI